VNTGLLNVLHDTADGDVAVLVTQCVHVQLVCSVQILVHKHRSVWVYLYSVLNVPLQVCLPAADHLGAQYCISCQTSLWQYRFMHTWAVLLMICLSGHFKRNGS